MSIEIFQDVRIDSLRLKVKIKLHDNALNFFHYLLFARLKWYYISFY